MTTTLSAARPARWKDLLFAVILLPLFLAMPVAVLQVCSATVWTAGSRYSSGGSAAVLGAAALLTLAATGVITWVARRLGYPVVAVVAAVAPFVYPVFIVVVLSSL
ncbi:hypothetical protein [Kitasatospora sp. NPDC057500]|uniref:hypothetical protein n=1 Tax=Kitasatospora sp. NPDC057500 TaxID=3346151 RepID=UPI0036C0360F